MSQMYDFIIVGSGISGLNTVYQLQKKKSNLKILMLEKDSKIGGRIQSVNLPQSMSYESGAIRFYPQHRNLLKLFREFKLTKKDFIKIPNDFPRDYVLTQKKFQKFKESESDLYKILLDTKNINSIPANQKMSITLEDYSKNILGKDKLEYLKVLNAFPHIFQTSMLYGLELLERDFMKVKEFYILKTLTLTDFLHLMLEKMEKNNLELHLSEEFLSYSEKKSSQLYQVKTNINTYLTKNIVFALPPVALKTIKQIPITLVNSAFPVPLCRMFAIYPANNYWYQDIKATYTNENIQRIYLKGSRLIQISYSSANKAEFWHKISKDQIKLKKELQKELKKIFPTKEITHPEYLKTHFWEGGVNIWKVRRDGNKITEKIIRPFSNKNIFVTNEAYSKNQRWMEGAVEMSHRVVELILNF